MHSLGVSQLFRRQNPIVNKGRSRGEAQAVVVEQILAAVPIARLEIGGMK
jgi:hypothetical protein